jgi:hypothetical protein
VNTEDSDVSSGISGEIDIDKNTYKMELLPELDPVDSRYTNYKLSIDDQLVEDIKNTYLDNLAKNVKANVKTYFVDDMLKPSKELKDYILSVVAETAYRPAQANPKTYL